MAVLSLIFAMDIQRINAYLFGDPKNNLFHAAVRPKSPLTHMNNVTTTRNTLLTTGPFYLLHIRKNT